MECGKPAKATVRSGSIPILTATRSEGVLPGLMGAITRLTSRVSKAYSRQPAAASVGVSPIPIGLPYDVTQCRFTAVVNFNLEQPRLAQRFATGLVDG